MLLEEIFFEIPVIHVCHSEFYRQLCQRTDNWADNKTIGDLFIEAVRLCSCPHLRQHWACVCVSLPTSWSPFVQELSSKPFLFCSCLDGKISNWTAKEQAYLWVFSSWGFPVISDSIVFCSFRKEPSMTHTQGTLIISTRQETLSVLPFISVPAFTNSLR